MKRRFHLPLLFVTLCATLCFARPASAYAPPKASLAVLGSIQWGRAVPIPTRRLLGLRFLARLPGGAIYLDSRLECDSDGTPNSPRIDATGQRCTSFEFAHERGQRQFVNAARVRYFVLPLRLYPRLGMHLGDVAAVIYRRRVAFAVFADEGPRNIIGEGSTALVRALGCNPCDRRGHIVNGIDEDVITICFPGSAPHGLTPSNLNAKVEATARNLFRALGGRA